jgi:hypothetical protein
MYLHVGEMRAAHEWLSILWGYELILRHVAARCTNSQRLPFWLIVTFVRFTEWLMGCGNFERFTI